MAAVLYVMIASPGDVIDAREAAYTALSRWNESNTRNRGVVLVPLRWETGAVPELGDHPQSIINKQLLHDADIVIAIFGSRVGTATPGAVSGTVGEVEHAVAANKPVHLYFSTAPHPNDVDPEQLLGLRQFQDQLRERGLYGSFGSAEELTASVWQAIERDLIILGVNDDDVPSARPGTEGIVIRAQAGQESVPKVDGRGRLKSQTRHWVDVRNEGDTDAEQLWLGSNADRLHFGGQQRPRTLHAGQSQRFPYMLTFGDDDPSVVVHWVEGREEKSKKFDI